MQVRDLNTLLINCEEVKDSKSKCYMTEQVKQFIENIKEKHHDENYVLSLKQKYHLIRIIELFYEDDNRLPWCRYSHKKTEKLVNGLRSFIIGEIYPGQKTSKQYQQVLQALICLHKNNRFTEEIYSLLQNRGESAIDTISEYLLSSTGTTAFSRPRLSML